MQHNHNFSTKLRVQYSPHDTTLSVTEMKHGMFKKKKHDSCKAVFVLDSHEPKLNLCDNFRQRAF